MMNWPVGLECFFIDTIGVDVEHSRFAVIDPDGYVSWHGMVVLVVMGKVRLSAGKCCSLPTK